MFAIQSIGIIFYLFFGFFTAEKALSENDANPVNVLEFPYYASIEANGEFICAATIIDDIYVMSSNSCLSGYDVQSLWVRVGTVKQGHRGEVFKVIQVFPYVTSGMNFGPPTPITFSTDVAIIKIAVAFTFDPHVLWLNPNNDGIQELQEGVVATWENPKVKSSPLISASVIVLPTANCSAIYNGVKNITSTEYCIWQSDVNSRPCLAALGAPLYYNEQFYGLVTHNPGCSNTSFPVIVTAVSQFTSFIITILSDMASFYP